MKKRALALLVALLLCAGPVALAETNIFGWDVPDQPLVISIFSRNDNWTELAEQKQGIADMIKYLKDNFNIEFSYQTTDGNGTEELNRMLAANTYPDVLVNVETVSREQIVEQGRAVNLTEYVNNSPNLLKKMGSLKGMYEDDDGQIFYLPSYFGNLMDLPDYTSHVRYDEYTSIGSPKIETPQDYFDVIMQILEKYPTTPNGDSRYSLTFYNQGFPEIASGYWGLIRGYKVDADNNLTYWTETEEGKAMAKFFNNWWRTGTMDPESFTNLWNDARTKISQERVVGLIGGWWIGYNAGHEIWSLTDPNWTEEMRFIQVTFKAPEAEHAYLTCKNNLGSAWTIITDKCQDPAGVMKFIDFAMTDPGAALLNWGMPGDLPSYKDPSKTIAMWHITSPTDWSFDPVAKQQFIAEIWDYNDEGVFGVNTGIFDLVVNYDRWDDGESCVWGNQMWYSENKWKGIMFENTKGTIFDQTALLAQMLPMSPEVTMAYQAITDTWKQYYPLACMAASDEEFEAAWTTLQNAVRDADLATYVAYRTENYKRNLSKMGG